MKRKSSHRRRILFPTSFVRPVTKREPIFTRDSFPSRQPHIHAKKIFIIRQATQLPPTNSAEGKSAQHILIFDDHPESLRLVFGEPADPNVNRAAPRHITLWVISFSILMLGLLTAMFWPLL